MNQHDYHRHLIWSWDPGARQWHLLQDDVHRLEYDDGQWFNTEPEEAQDFQNDLSSANGGQMEWDPYDKVNRPVYPGRSHQPAPAYYVGYMGWNPGMPSWQWQASQMVIPAGQTPYSSAAEQSAMSAKVDAIMAQAQNLPTPDQSDTSERNQNIAVGVVVGLVTLVGLGIVIKVASHGA